MKLDIAALREAAVNEIARRTEAEKVYAVARRKEIDAHQEDWRKGDGQRLRRVLQDLIGRIDAGALVNERDVLEVAQTNGYGDLRDGGYRDPSISALFYRGLKDCTPSSPRVSTLNIQGLVGLLDLLSKTETTVTSSALERAGYGDLSWMPKVAA